MLEPDDDLVASDPNDNMGNIIGDDNEQQHKHIIIKQIHESIFKYLEKSPKIFLKKSPIPVKKLEKSPVKKFPTSLNPPVMELPALFPVFFIGSVILEMPKFSIFFIIILLMKNKKLIYES